MSKQSFLTVKQFFETQFRPFAIYDSERSIASAIDGQKITMRKVLYTCALKNVTNEIKVAQLASSVAFETAYHHGEAGIGGVICNMAQNYPGANNINLLEPIGQFGSRLNPTPAAARYIFTKMTKTFRELFKKDDDLVLEFNYDDEQKIEPKYYVPILPVVLINGTHGIGTGFASKVLSYNPADIKADILNKLNGKKRTPLVPWFKGYQGEITKGENENQWVFKGKLEVVNTTTIRITELPIGTYLDDIKATLNKLQEIGFIKDYDDDSSEDQFNITISAPRSTTMIEIDKLYEKFKLITRDTENLTLWAHNSKLRVFKDTATLIDYFVDFRIGKYEERRRILMKMTEEDILWINEKIRFINFYLANHQKFKNTAKKELIDLLLANNFERYSELLSMQLWVLTKDRIDELENELQSKLDYLDTLESTTPEKMYQQELKELKL